LNAAYASTAPRADSARSALLAILVAMTANGQLVQHNGTRAYGNLAYVKKLGKNSRVSMKGYKTAGRDFN